MLRQRAPSGLLTWGAFLLVAACLAMLISSQLFFAYDIDRDARERSKVAADRAVADYARDLTERMLPQVYWDDAVIRLDNRFDPAWAKMMMVDYFNLSQGMDGVAIFDRANRPLMVNATDAKGVKISNSAMSRAAAPILRDVRRQEARRAPLPKVQPSNTKIHKISSWAVARIDGQPFVLAAGLVQPDQFAQPVTSRSAIVLIAKRLDAATVADIGGRHTLDDLKVINLPGTPVEGRAYSFLRNSDGLPIAALTWVPRSPGTAFLGRIWPFLVLFCVLVGGAIIAMTLRARRLTRSLVTSEAKASHLAFHDILTGLPNRAKLEEAYDRISDRARSSGTSFAMLCIDLDHFKAVNDSLGHLAGDALIRIIAARVQSCCGPQDFLARFGGDEFVVLQEKSDAKTAGAFAERMIAAIAEPVELEPGRAFVGASIGIVVCSWETLSANECLRRADMALYDAKEAGRNGYRHFSPVMDREVRRRQQMRTQLHDALRDGGIHLHYQPQVDGTGALVGVEALSRWDVEGTGPIGPGDFVPIAEESGLIDSLGLFIFRQAFEDSRDWPGVKVAINVSAIQLRSGDFVDSVRDLVRKSGVDPRQFELEITERLLVADDRNSLAILRQLRRMGFRIVLDDFGTGYSSLAYLQRYPIDKVKIDRTFVSQIDRDEQAEAVVVAIIQLARALGLDVIAEGVETEEQRQCLLAAGCPDVQGFLTGRPVPAEAISDLVNPPTSLSA